MTKFICNILYASSVLLLLQIASAQNDAEAASDPVRLLLNGEYETSEDDEVVDETLARSPRDASWNSTGSSTGNAVGNATKPVFHVSGNLNATYEPETSTVRLICPEIDNSTEWFKLQKQIHPSTRFQFDDGDLLVMNFTEKDGGIFACETNQTRYVGSVNLRNPQVATPKPPSNPLKWMIPLSIVAVVASAGMFAWAISSRFLRCDLYDVRTEADLVNGRDLRNPDMMRWERT